MSQPETLFVSDVHLSAARRGTVRRFLRFLQQRADRAERLYLLGDIFDAWVGDDDNTYPNRAVKHALRRLTASGTQVFFQPGNRDFLVGEKFAQETGVRLLPDYAVIDLYGTPTLLMHGDLLCSDDLSYLAFRARSRTPAWQAQILDKPLWLRLLGARWYRWRSLWHKAGKSAAIMDVNPATVREALQRQGVNRLIHGHTHRPALHNLPPESRREADKLRLPESRREAEQFRLLESRREADRLRLPENQPAQRFVLAEWTDQGSVLCWNRDGHWLENC